MATNNMAMANGIWPKIVQSRRTGHTYQLTGQDDLYGLTRGYQCLETGRSATQWPLAWATDSRFQVLEWDHPEFLLLPEGF